MGEIADIYTVRPEGETFNESCNAISKELKVAGLKPSRIVEGHIQPDGSTLYYVYIKKVN